MPMTTPMPHAQWIDWAPAENGVSTVWATTPHPKTISVKVPRSSADSSPSSVFRLNSVLLARCGAQAAAVGLDAQAAVPPGQRELRQPSPKRSGLSLLPFCSAAAEGPHAPFSAVRAAKVNGADQQANFHPELRRLVAGARQEPGRGQFGQPSPAVLRR